jgi:hypothetical protein
VAVHLGKANFSQPIHLLVQSRESVGRVVLNSPNLTTKALMEARGRGAYEIEIREDAAWSEQAMHFTEQLSLAAVLKVMDRQPRHDDLGRSGVRERYS